MHLIPEVRAQVVASVSVVDLHKVIKSNVAQGATLYTDGWVGYRGLKAMFNHSTVDHGAKEYVNGDCHRRTAAGLEFAVVECLPLKSWEMKDVLNSGHDAREVLQTFVRDQRQVLNLWKTDVTAQVREHLDEKYPHQDMGIVVESFDIKLARDISQRPALVQNHSRGVRI
jgi:hypothetical protein